MRYFVNGPVSREVALMGVEKFKLTGSLKKMFESMESYSSGSMISVSGNDGVLFWFDNSMNMTDAVVTFTISIYA